MSKPTKRNTEDQPTQAADEDFAIYPHRDHITQASMPFKLHDYGDKGAFNEDQIRELSDRHSLTIEQIRELSRLVGYALDIESQVSLVSISRTTAARRLRNRKLGKRNRDKQLDAAEANALFDGFGCDVRVAEEAVVSRSNSGAPTRHEMHHDGVTIVSLDDAQRILQPDDRTKERDSRRILVVEACCYVARDAGWRVTYTSDSTALKDQRGGRLINLIKDVIAMVSHNAHKASVHTLKDDLVRVSRRFERRERKKQPPERR
ncbi:hypothetical protein [Yoonia sp.]|uniref:hypothetical protein n=1 Tax=Yoonia sp. TaxID=2212373 RepID=UPI002E041FEA|nr:hypothetical protein [Yoonia sp.]